MSAAPLDRQQATPLLHTPTHDSDPSGSDFLLLTTHHSAPAFCQLPRPRFLPVLQLAAVTDLLWTLIYAAPLAYEARTGLWVALTLSAARPLLVLGVVSSVRVREKGHWILTLLGLSFLVLLYHLNELVQSSAYDHHPTLPSPTLPPAPRPSSALTLRSSSLTLSNGLSLQRSATTWYITSFLFSLLHYLLYAVFVGIRRRRNPFIGRRSASVGVGGRRASGWGEQRWEGSEERVPAPRGAEGEMEREELLAGRAVGSSDDEDEFDDFEDGFQSSEDEDDIVDIDRPSLRSRRSTASFLVDGGSRPREEGGPPSMPRSSSQYGTITSLAGI